MLKIRLARWGKKKAAFFRVVLTEHTKPVKSGYMKVLWWFNPLTHTSKIDIEAMKEWIWKWAQPSNRVAKIAFAESGDSFFEKYITKIPRVRKKRNAVDEPEAPVEEAKPEETQAEEQTEQKEEAQAEQTQE